LPPVNGPQDDPWPTAEPEQEGHDVIKIRDVEAYALKDFSVLVVVRSEDGTEGIGECYPIRAAWGARLLANFVREGLAPKIIGMDALEADVIWSRMYHGVTPRQGDKGIMLPGISGLDIAIWDLIGKVLGQPVHVLLGGRHRRRVPAYASIGGGADMTPDEMVRAVARYREQGFGAFKIRMHWGSRRLDVAPAKDLAMFRAVRRLLGDGVPLAFDANNGYSSASAIRQGRSMEEDGLAFFEEPVPVQDYAGLASVADALDTPVGAGEQEYTRWQIRDLIDRGHVDIVQPDVLKCGGLTEMRKCMWHCELCHKTFLPHQNQAIIGLSANLHLLSAIPDDASMMEYTGPQPAIAQLFAQIPIPKDGWFEVPDEPGIGVRLNRTALGDFLL
jgi:L-alanine-DL-glutamate epimerase-like enolase superfamily enzyme